MTGQRSQLINFVSKFLGTVRFGNDQVARIMRYGDCQIGNVIIYRISYVEGLRDNLFSVGQFCDSDLKVAFRKHTYFVRNLEVADLLIGLKDTNLYTLLLDDMLKSSLICLLSKASKSKSWLWHQRLSDLNFGTINELAKQGLVRGLPKLKYEKDHLCSACSLGKSKKHTHKPKSEDSTREKLYLLHMDLCNPMRTESINGNKYILVIVDDYSRNIRTNNGIEFVNQTLKTYYEDARISHQISIARTSQQNDIVKRCNRALVEAARTMLIFSKAPLYMWGEALTPNIVSCVLLAIAPIPVDTTGTTSSTSIDQDAPSASTSPTSHKTQSLVISEGFEEQLQPTQFDNHPFQDILTSEPSS
ncbi:retrovirus-related pol polyprotein from transposon TNT 1-94 [Tanacetum coccineum]